MSKFNINNIVNITILFSLCLLLNNCSVGSSNIVSNPGNGVQLVNLGNISKIPLISGSVSNVILPINNNSNDNVRLINANIQISGTAISKSQQEDLIDGSSCQNIAANSSCNLIITPPKSSGGFVINLIYANSNGVQYKTSQLINYSSNVHVKNGFIYFAPDALPNVIKHSLSIPVILAENYSKVSIAKNKLPAGVDADLFCPNRSLISGTMCTITIQYNQDLYRQSTSSMPQLLIIGSTRNGQHQNFLPIVLSLTYSNAANLVTSGFDTIINPTNSSSPTITLFNNGVGTASNINIYGLTPLTIDRTGGCTTTLAAGNSCTFTITANTADASGYSHVLISYNNGVGQTINLIFNVYYIPMYPVPSLSVMTNGWLINTMQNTINYQGVYIINNGNVNLNNLQFGNINNISGMNYGGNGQTCINGMSLAPESSCVMVVNYAPSTAVAIGNSINVAVAASYNTQSGSNLSYVNSVNIPYSANATSSGRFIAAGDYGAITSSVTTPAGTWTVQNNTPFTAAATTIARMVNNGTLQVVGTGGTAAGAGFIYQGQKGMIWQSASGGTRAPPTGVANNAITGLTYDSTNGYLVSNNQAAGNLYSITNITGITPTWNTIVAGAFVNQPFNLFNFGQSLAYIAPENTATVGQELDVSTTPTSGVWTAVNPTGAARAYIAALYDGSRYCVLSTTRFVSCANSAGFTTGSTWTQNGTTIYTAGNVNMVANNGSSSYAAILSASPFVVFLTSPSNPATAGIWTTAATPPSAALTWVAYGNGQYIGVSAASPGLVWTSPTGNVWTQRTSGTANSPINAPYGFIYYDGTSYWASGTRVLKVSQDGINWSNAGIFDLTYTYIGSNINYLAAGTVGAIESSTNLTSWTLESSNTTNKLNAIKCFNSNNCYAVGESGTLLFSNDGGGANWTSESIPTTKNLNSIACGYTNCVVVGESGTILAESTGSNNWVAESSGIIQNLNSVTFFNAYNIYVAVGNGGTILTSPDGISWSQVATGGNNLNSVACFYSRVGCMAVGVNGTVRTSISGVFWVTGTSATATSYAVTFHNGYWILSQAAAVRYSLDSTTLTWSTVATGITNIAAMNMRAILAP